MAHVCHYSLRSIASRAVLTDLGHIDGGGQTLKCFLVLLSVMYIINMYSCVYNLDRTENERPSRRANVCLHFACSGQSPSRNCSMQ